MRKKILMTFILTGLLLFAIGIVTVSAQLPKTGSCGDNLTYVLDTNYTLTISGSGDMDSYTYYYDGDRKCTAPWFSYAKDIRKVVIGEAVTSIGDYAFYRFEDVLLNSITIPDGVTSIGKSAFYGCDYVDSFIIPDSVTSIGDSAFSDCLNLKSVTLPKNLTSISAYLFQASRSLTSITIPDSVTSIGERAFRYCYDLASITIPDTVTSIGAYAFDTCKSLTDIIIPDNVTSIGEFAFSSCSGLSDITIPGNVQSIGASPFYNATNLESISVNSNNQYFSSDNGVLLNKNMTELLSYPLKKSNSSYEIPDTVTSIAERAFQNCLNIASITMPNGVKNIGLCAFSGCSHLSVVNYNGNEDLWEAISIDKYNDNLHNATKNYFWYVTYIDENGNLFQKDMLSPNTIITLPEIPVEDGCNIKFYTDEAFTVEFDTNTSLNKNIIIYFKIVTPDALTAVLQKDSAGYNFAVSLNKNKIENFETATLIAALYNGETLIAISHVPAKSTDAEIPITIKTTGAATKAKVILLDDFSTLKPLCKNAELTFN